MMMGFFSKGKSLKDWLLEEGLSFLLFSYGKCTTNVYGLVFLYEIDILALIGFYRMICYFEPTPKGDLIKWLI